MSEIEVIEKTVHGVGDIGNYYGGLFAAKTECGGYAWAIENCDGARQWQLIPESLYIELVKFNSAPIQIGDKVKINEIGIKAIIDNSTQWTDSTIIAKAIAQNNGTITAISLSSNLFVVEFGTATFYLNPEMVDRIEVQCDPVFISGEHIVR